MSISGQVQSPTYGQTAGTQTVQPSTAQPYQPTYGTTYQPQPQPQPQPSPPPAATPMDPVGLMFTLALVGIILALTGVIIMDLAAKLNDFVAVTRFTGEVLEMVGLMLISIGLLVGLIKANQLPDQVRLGIAIALALIVAYNL